MKFRFILMFRIAFGNGVVSRHLASSVFAVNCFDRFSEGNTYGLGEESNFGHLSYKIFKKVESMKFCPPNQKIFITSFFQKTLSRAECHVDTVCFVRKSPKLKFSTVR